MPVRSAAVDHLASHWRCSGRIRATRKSSESQYLPQYVRLHAWMDGCGAEFKNCQLLSSLTAYDVVTAFRGYMHVEPCLREATDVACMPAGLCRGAELHRLRALPGGERPHRGRHLALPASSSSPTARPATRSPFPHILVIAMMPVSICLELLGQRWDGSLLARGHQAMRG